MNIDILKILKEGIVKNYPKIIETTEKNSKVIIKTKKQEYELELPNEMLNMINEYKLLTESDKEDSTGEIDKTTSDLAEKKREDKNKLIEQIIRLENINTTEAKQKIKELEKEYSKLYKEINDIKKVPKQTKLIEKYENDIKKHKLLKKIQQYNMKLMETQKQVKTQTRNNIQTPTPFY